MAQRPRGERVSAWVAACGFTLACVGAWGCAPPAGPEPSTDPDDEVACGDQAAGCTDAATDAQAPAPDACGGVESCDDADNDCDGRIDEGLSCDAPAVTYTVTCNLYDGFNTLQSTVDDIDGRATEAFGNILCGPNNCGVSAADCKAKAQGVADATAYPVLFKLFSDGGANAVEVQTFRLKVGTPVGGGANWCGTPVGGGALVCRKWLGKGEAKLPADAIANVECRTHGGGATSDYADAVHWNGSNMMVPGGAPMKFLGDCLAE